MAAVLQSVHYNLDTIAPAVDYCMFVVVAAVAAVAASAVAVVVLVVVVVVFVAAKNRHFAVDSSEVEAYSCFGHVENSIHSAMKTMDSRRSIAVVDHLIGIQYVFSSADHCIAFVVTVKTGNPYEIVRVH